ISARSVILTAAWQYRIRSEDTCLIWKSRHSGRRCLIPTGACRGCPTYVRGAAENFRGAVSSCHYHSSFADCLNAFRKRRFILLLISMDTGLA
ncbi:MAG: hypothetical protein II922_09775, partial [Succinimonas sp.]|nr:hypothetical protein [Succinimonas sp.]